LQRKEIPFFNWFTNGSGRSNRIYDLDYDAERPAGEGFFVSVLEIAYSLPVLLLAIATGRPIGGLRDGSMNAIIRSWMYMRDMRDFFR
jgi:hypothetical protein